MSCHREGRRVEGGGFERRLRQDRRRLRHGIVAEVVGIISIVAVVIVVQIAVGSEGVPGIISVHLSY